MGLTPQQPHFEFFNTECYGGPSRMFEDYLVNHRSAFAMISELFRETARDSGLDIWGSYGKPVINHEYSERFVRCSRLSGGVVVLVMRSLCKEPARAMWVKAPGMKI